MSSKISVLTGTRSKVTKVAKSTPQPKDTAMGIMVLAWVLWENISGSKPAKGQMSPMQKAIYDWMSIKGIRLRDKSSGKFKKSSEELKQQVAKLIMFKVRRDGIKGWKAFDYAFENIWDEYESKVVEAYGKDFNAVIENQLKDI